MGGDITVTGIDIGLPTDKINLSGHSLSFVETEDLRLRQIYSNITGNGVVNYDTNEKYSINGSNTYTGTTNIIKGSVGNGLYDIEMFGISDVNISDLGRVDYSFDKDRVIGNKITINSNADENNVVSLSFTDGEDTKISLLNLTLNVNSRFLNNTHNLLAIDLVGIKSNGYCVWYMGGDDGDTDRPSIGFINGPTICKETAKATGNGLADASETNIPTAPNNAIQKLILANPIAVVLMGIATAVVITLFARRQLGRK
jgi:hypothetical protein